VKGLNIKINEWSGEVNERHTFLTELVLLLQNGVGAVILVEERVDVVLIFGLEPPVAWRGWGGCGNG
jgi:hypothetical protein